MAVVVYPSTTQSMCPFLLITAYGSWSKLRNGAAFWAMATGSRTNMMRDLLVIWLEISRLKSPSRSAKAARVKIDESWTPPLPE